MSKSAISNPQSAIRLNRSTEDYLKSIYTLQRGQGTVSTSLLARHLRIGDGSVTDMVKKLSKQRLINYAPYRGVTLTPAGERLALKMVRRHRLWEMFLMKFLDYTWDEIHEEAERLEHVTSDGLEERLDRALGFPRFDPHGEPIPTAAGKISEAEGRPLAECAVNERGTIVRVKDESHEVLKLMTKLGLGLRAKITIKQKLAFDGSVVIGFGTKEIPLSPKMAGAIYIQT